MFGILIVHESGSTNFFIFVVLRPTKYESVKLVCIQNLKKINRVAIMPLFESGEH